LLLWFMNTTFNHTFNSTRCFLKQSFITRFLCSNY
jgi:hypothetical protein